MKKLWVRVRVQRDGAFVWGHAGRYGYIMPCKDRKAGKFVGTTYDHSEMHFDDLVSSLKQILDAIGEEDAE